MKDVEGKVAFITGGASGVGLGMVQVFTAAGMKVVIADIRQDHLDQAMNRLAGATVHAIRMDVTDRAAFERAALETEKVFGPVHLLCNNAGVNLFVPIDECTYDDWDWVVGVNLGGVVNGIQTFVPRIKAHGEGGHIVNTGSMASFISGPRAGIYTTSKFAIRGLSECLRWSLVPHNIGVSILCPGLVKSAIYESSKTRPEHLSLNIGALDAQFFSQLEALHQEGMEPEEVAERVLIGIKKNDMYIFSHPEFKDELTKFFSEILSTVPIGEVDPQRLAFEESRRRESVKAKGH